MVIHAPSERVDGINDNVVYAVGWSRPPYIPCRIAPGNPAWAAPSKLPFALAVADDGNIAVRTNQGLALLRGGKW